ncbi:MAG TPA: FoF1 ATP synthase subunit gamma, partial [Patescibacteria group bacterium]|nr:FoF1 ATP synthase subunit gamma [Patescibacteria group bacterium]
KHELANPERLKINRMGQKIIESPVSDQELKIDYITIGKKGDNMIRKLGGNIIATFPDLAYQPKPQDVRPLANIIMEEYLKKTYDKVVIVYTDFISTLNQQTKIRQVLPVSKVDIEKQIAEIDQHAEDYGLIGPKVEYKIEPSPKEVLTHIFPRLIEMQIYHAIQESNASKESARMIAMRNATEAAGEMVGGLTLMYNQIRQSKITQEIAEISAGAAALEN